jgi:branched-chain amino acid transport system ATP-binding protein
MRGSWRRTWEARLLEIRGLRVAYGGIVAVKGINLDVGGGELVCLIGANGAGKTTTLKAIAGLLPASEGSIRLAGQAAEHLPAHRRVRLGLALVPEGRGIFGRLTVRENLRMGAYHRDDSGIERDFDHVLALMPRLAERLEQTGGTLSGGEQQMLAIGRALMSKPKLLLLDEPSMGLAPAMVGKLFEIVRKAVEAGLTLLLVEQNAKLALEMAQRAYVMESGCITLAGASRELLVDPRVREAYLGETPA